MLVVEGGVGQWIEELGDGSRSFVVRAGARDGAGLCIISILDNLYFMP